MADPFDLEPKDEGQDAPPPTTTRPPSGGTSRPAPAPTTTGGGGGFGLEPAPAPGGGPEWEDPFEGQYTPQRDIDTEAAAKALEVAMEQKVWPTYESQPEQVEDLIEFVLRIYHFGVVKEDDELKNIAIEARTMANHLIPPEVQEKYGLETVPLKEDPYAGGLLGDAKAFGKDMMNTAFGDTWVGRNIGGPLMRFFDSASQGALAGIGEIREGRPITGVGAFAQGATYGAGGNILNAAGITEGATGREVLEEAVQRHETDQDSHLNLREAVGIDSEWGGRWAGAFDTIGVALTDPFTWVGLGAAGKAAVGLRSVARTQGDDVARIVARQGLGALDDRARVEVFEDLVEQATKGQTQRRAGILRRPPGSPEAIEKLATKQLQSMRSGVGTFRIGGTNIRLPGVDDARTAFALRKVDGVDRFGEVGRLALRGDEEGVARMFGDGVHTITPTSGGVRIAGDILNEADETIGGFTLQLRDDGVAVLDEIGMDVPGQGGGGAFLNRTINRLRANGFDTIEMAAEGDGLVVWPKKGFVPNPAGDGADMAWRMQAQAIRNRAAGAREGFQAPATSPALYEGPGLYDAIDQYVDDAGEALIGIDNAAMADAIKGRAAEMMDTVGNPKELKDLADDIDKLVRGGEIDDALMKLDTFDGVFNDIDETMGPGRAGVVDDADAQLDELATETGAEQLDDLAKRIEDAVAAGRYDDLGKIMRSPEYRSAAKAMSDELAPVPLIRHLDNVDDSLRSFTKTGTSAVRKPSLGARLVRIARMTPEELQAAGISKTAKVGARAATVPLRAKEALTPRATIKRILGRRAAEAFDEVRSRSAGTLNREMEDFYNRLGPAADRAAREVKSMETADAVVRKALEEVGEEGEEALTTVLRAADEIAEEGFPEIAEYLRVSAQLRDGMEKHAIEAGLDVEHLRQGYFPRTLTETGRKALFEGADDKLLKQLGIDRGKLRGREARFHQPRTFLPDKSIDEVNAELARKLGLPEDMKLFEDNVMSAFALRGEAAYRAAADTVMLKGLADEVIQIGDSRLNMVIKATDDANWKPPKDYVEIPDIQSGWYAHKEIVKELEQMHGFITNNEMLAKMADFFENWSKTWGAYATAPLTDGLGFHSRNGASNLVLNMLAGVANPTHYGNAIRLQTQMTRAFHRMRQTGKSFDDAIKELNLDPADVAKINALRDYDIVSSGWFADIAPTNRLPRTRGKRLKRYDGTWDFLQNNLVVRSGRKFGSAVEHNARIAHYLAKIAAGDSPDMAATSVKRYLFDYSDLTGVEEALKNVSRFYTFMRKNLGVQMWSLARNPGRVNSIQRAVTGGGGIGDALGLRGQMGQPDYSAERGDSNFLGDILGGNQRDIIGGVDMPLTAAFEALRPVVEIGLALSGDGDYKRTLGSLLNLTAGGQASFVQTVYDQIAEYNTAFGYEMSEEQKGAEARVRAWLDATIGPIAGQVDTAIERLTGGKGLEFLGEDLNVIGNNPSQTNVEFGPEMFVLANILGFNAAAMDSEDEFNKDLMYTYRNELQMLLDELKDMGENVPPLEDFRDAGWIPRMPESPERASSVTTRERIERLEEQGLPVPEDVRQRYEEILAEESARGTLIDPETGEYTIRDERAREMALSLGFATESDPNRGAMNNGIKALWNREHPDDQFLNEEGEPYTVYDVEVLWPGPSQTDVYDWAVKVGAPLTPKGNVGKATYTAYNEAHPNDPYIRYMSQLDRAAQGFLPVQGVAVLQDDTGQTKEFWPRGQNSSNWELWSDD